LGVGRERARARESGGSARPGWRWALAERLVLGRIRAGLGLDRASGLLSGAAPLQPEVTLFLQALGLELYEAYGLTETCPGLTANRPGAVRVGTVGQALPGVVLAVAADGEILARGPNITVGYLNRDEETKAVNDEDGWFHTGDLGSIDADGFVTITGRKKELIKTAGGKYVAPTKIEGALKLSPLVSEAVVVGDGRPYCVALLAVDPEAADELVAQSGGDGPAALDEALDAHVRATNAGLASFETVKYWRTIEPPSIETGDMTASLKVRRTEIQRRWVDVIEDMYSRADRGRTPSGAA
jgi:long-chain acyl-CoA synthetase